MTAGPDEPGDDRGEGWEEYPAGPQPSADEPADDEEEVDRRFDELVGREFGVSGLRGSSWRPAVLPDGELPTGPRDWTAPEEDDGFTPPVRRPLDPLPRWGWLVVLSAAYAVVCLCLVLAGIGLPVWVSWTALAAVALALSVGFSHLAKHPPSGGGTV